MSGGEDLRSERAAAARQHARYAAEDAARSIMVGRIGMARQSLRDALGLLDEADAIEQATP